MIINTVMLISARGLKVSTVTNEPLIMYHSATDNQPFNLSVLLTHTLPYDRFGNLTIKQIKQIKQIKLTKVHSNVQFFLSMTETTVC